jgi:hypothetical protein
MIVPQKRAQKRRLERRIRIGCTPPQWRRYVIAGATVCHCIQALAQSTHAQERLPDKEEAEHDST